MARMSAFDILAALTSDILDALTSDDDDETSILLEAAVMRLKEAYPRYTSKNPFEAGDLVTPVKGSNVKGAGNPHLVVEVFDPIVKMFEAGSNGNAPLDMRVICITPNDNISAYYVEHADFEPYTGPGS